MDLSKTIKSGFPGKRIVIAGDLVADQFLHGSISRVSREAPVFILRHENTETRPGAAANAAANVASLGGTPLLVGVIGTDANGQLLLDSLATAGVESGFVLADRSAGTTTKVRVLSGHTHSARQQVIRIDYENRTSIGPDLRRKLLENFASAAAGADAIIISDYNYGVGDAALFEAARRAASESRIPLFVDSRFRLREFSGANAATPNQEEVEEMIGSDFSAEDCVGLCRELGFEAMIVTRGSKGMTVIESNGGTTQLPAIGSTDPVDVTGAGDTVMAAFALGVASELSFIEAAALANHAGGIVVMKKGTATVSADELLGSVTSAPPLARVDAAG